MRLVWKYDAGFPEPVCNKPVFSLDGKLLGHPRPLRPRRRESSVSTAAIDHTEADKRRDDRAREDRLLEHGLSFFELVTGDLQQHSSRRTTHATCPE